MYLSGLDTKPQVVKYQASVYLSGLDTKPQVVKGETRRPSSKESVYILKKRLLRDSQKPKLYMIPDRKKIKFL